MVYFVNRAARGCRIKIGVTVSIYVVDPGERSKVPFLRGILTRSLVKAGLPFDRAYEVADSIRDEIGPDGEVTTDDLRRMVHEELKSAGEKDVLKRYRAVKSGEVPIRVVDREGTLQPFSKGHLGSSLEICAIPSERVFAITLGIERYLLRSGITRIEALELARLTYKYLLEHESDLTARRYITWRKFVHGDRPLILLIGGTTGCGKSTISSEVAHRLGIVRTQSTDMLREVMRLMIPERLLPTLHTSSFNAWEALPTWKGQPARLETHFEQGYLAQANHVSVGIEGVMSRAEREEVSLIIEGVHVYPELQRRLQGSSQALVIPFILAVLKKKRLRKQLQGRGQQIRSRRSERYLAYFDAIWQQQSFLLSEADRHDVPIIPNEDQDDTIKLVMDQIAEAVADEFPEDEFIASDEAASLL